jgi:hypothetical protein
MTLISENDRYRPRSRLLSYSFWVPAKTLFVSTDSLSSQERLADIRCELHIDRPIT